MNANEINSSHSEFGIWNDCCFSTCVIYLIWKTVLYHYLYPIITVLVFLGAFVSQGNLFAIILTLIMMLLGVFMAWAGLPTTPFILTFVLGELLETNFRRAMSYSRNGLLTFFQHPASCVLLVAAIAFILYNMFGDKVKALISKKK